VVIFNPLGDVVLRIGLIRGFSTDGSIAPQRRKIEEKNVCFCCVLFSFSVLSQEIGWEEGL